MKINYKLAVLVFTILVITVMAGGQSNLQGSSTGENNGWGKSGYQTSHQGSSPSVYTPPSYPSGGNSGNNGNDGNGGNNGHNGNGGNNGNGGRRNWGKN